MTATPQCWLEEFHKLTAGHRMQWSGARSNRVSEQGRQVCRQMTVGVYVR